MTNKAKVSILISALNEQDNIGKLLSSLLTQKIDNFILDEILVISDGSTDNTVRIANGFGSKIIKVIDHKSRYGKADRLSEGFGEIKSDVIIVLDADLSLKDHGVLENMVRPFMGDHAIGMVGGNFLPLVGNSFVQNAINSSFRAYSRLRNQYHSLSVGPIVAYRSSLAKQIKFPKGLVGEDAFGYLSCLNLGYKYHYAEKAVVYIKTPHTLKDHITQNVRFIATPSVLSKYFPAELVRTQDYVAPYHFYLSLFREFILHPQYCLYIFLINQYCRLLAILNKDKLNTKWEIANSTK